MKFSEKQSKVRHCLFPPFQIAVREQPFDSDGEDYGFYKKIF